MTLHVKLLPEVTTAACPLSPLFLAGNSAILIALGLLFSRGLGEGRFELGACPSTRCSGSSWLCRLNTPSKTIVAAKGGSGGSWLLLGICLISSPQCS